MRSQRVKSIKESNLRISDSFLSWTLLLHYWNLNLRNYITDGNSTVEREPHHSMRDIGNYWKLFTNRFKKFHCARPWSNFIYAEEMIECLLWTHRLCHILRSWSAIYRVKEENNLLDKSTIVYWALTAYHHQNSGRWIASNLTNSHSFDCCEIPDPWRNSDHQITR